MQHRLAFGKHAKWFFPSGEPPSFTARLRIDIHIETQQHHTETTVSAILAVAMAKTIDLTHSGPPNRSSQTK